MEVSELSKKFSQTDISEFPAFHNYDKTLEMSLWVLWVAKDKLEIKKLTAEQIAFVIRDVKEMGIDAESITKSFNRAKDKIYTYIEKDATYYEIMKPGKEHMLSKIKKGVLDVFYFEPERKYSSKKFVMGKILSDLKGELRMVDPYCGERTLDIIRKINDKPIKFLTQLNKLGRNRNKFLRELQDFKSEYQNIEFRDYPHNELHDRYIISSKHLVLLGHSIKDLGGKESFAIALHKDTNKNIFEAVLENFNRRWKQSTKI